MLAEALERWSDLGATSRLSRVVHFQILAAWQRGDFQRMIDLSVQSFESARATGHEVDLASALLGRGVARLRLGSLDDARSLLQDALARFETARYARGVAWASQYLADVEEVQGNIRGSAELRRASIEHYHRQRDVWGMFEEVSALAGLGTRAGQLTTAARLLGATSAFAESTGIAPENRVQSRERTQAALRARLGGAAFTEAWMSGRSLPVDEVLAEATALTDAVVDTSPVPSSPRLPGGLSEREAEVVRLLAAGLSNAEIADRLFLSPHTVRAYLHRIYAKLEIGTRAEAVRYALERGSD